MIPLSKRNKYLNGLRETSALIPITQTHLALTVQCTSNTPNLTCIKITSLIHQTDHMMKMCNNKETTGTEDQETNSEDQCLTLMINTASMTAMVNGFAQKVNLVMEGHILECLCISFCLSSSEPWLAALLRNAWKGETKDTPKDDLKRFRISPIQQQLMLR